MEHKLSPIKLDSYQPLREVVCETLRDAIRKGTLKPGERLMEIQLAEELGVSRTPVREAIRKLELEGYVIMMPRRGTYVANLSIRDVNEVFEIRTSLDSLASGLAAERITDEELERLQRLLVAIGGYIEANDMEKIVETDTEFVCRVDGERRLDFMRKHSAEHIISGIHTPRRSVDPHTHPNIVLCAEHRADGFQTVVPSLSA